MGQGDGEWNQVTRKRGRKPAIEQQQPKGELEGLLGGIRPNPNPELTVAEIRKYHESVDQEWRLSGCWETLQKALLTGCATPDDGPLITSAICLGPGPFDPANGSLLVRRTAHMQTAAFTSIVANLESQSRRSIKRMVQEPGFTQVDKQFCNELGFEVVDTPAAFTMVDSTTMVFGIHMELQTYADSLTVLPGIFIGSGLDEWENLMNVNPEPPGLRPMREMDANYNKFSFPDLNYMFYGTTVYWRQRSKELEATDLPSNQ
ncbi:hypothetical protein B0T16DRAFT_317047 [Cercophora newfieldiana]|uniref:SRR1-like domain-containing protein n=1 Tax=Cercophora newfieldiana TaxID=92897 RepID=A0AA39YPA2_9PEZI|nr:hypothetical protein B0T16DRAFT_317047 [Cercophora newfieldiana]